MGSALRALNSLDDKGMGAVATPIPTVTLKQGWEVQDIWNNAKAKEKKKMQEEELNVSDIKTWQRTVQKKGVERILKSGNYYSGSSSLPIVVKHNGNYVLMDGNHRVAAAILTKTKKIRVKVFEK